MIKLPSLALATSLMIAYFQDVNSRKIKPTKDGRMTKKIIKILAIMYVGYLALIIYWGNCG